MELVNFTPFVRFHGLIALLARVEMVLFEIKALWCGRGKKGKGQRFGTAQCGGVDRREPSTTHGQVRNKPREIGRRYAQWRRPVLSK